jgi:hypothetical protein
MDQLKVVLEHRFWILSALAVLLPPIGWWVSTGDMATKTDKRTKDIQGSVKQLETLKKGLPSTANNDWIDGAKQVNVKLGTVVDQTHKQLYEHQRPAMVWHPLVRKALDQAQVKFRQENAVNPKAFNMAKGLFITRYVDMWKSDVYNVVEPFEALTNPEGKVVIAEGTGLPITRAPVEFWAQRQSVSSQEMWDAQEDLWMLHALMTAVARVNEGSVNIDDSRIKRLVSATLRGGSPTDLLDRRKKKDAKAAPAAAAAGAAGAPTRGLSLSWGSSPADAADSGPTAIAAIEPDDIFGSADDSSAGPQGSKKGPSVVESANANRYARMDPGGKWHARGFVLRVVMDHQEIPKLLTVLTQGPFPVEIWQVEHQPFDFRKDRQTALAGGETEAQQKAVKSAQERLSLAMNQVNLADVLVAGVFILYNEPGDQATAAPGTAGKASDAAKAPVGATPPAGGKSPQPAIPSAAGAALKNPPAGKAASSAGASSGAPKPDTAKAPATSSPAAPNPTAPKPPAAKTAQPTKS